MTIYIDALFLLDFIVDYLLLLLTGKVTGSPLKRLRLLLSGALGGAYSVLCAVTGLPYLTHPLVKLACAVLLALISYGQCRHFLRCFLIFLSLSAAFGGGLYALSLAAGTALIIDVPTVFFFAAIAYGTMALAGRKLARHGPAELRQVTIHLGESSESLTALVDTGNTLTDPISGQGVLVVDGARLAPLLPEEADYCHPAECFQKLPKPGRFRLLPYKSVGIDSGLLLAVRADALEVDGKPIPAPLIALSPTPVSDTGIYQALLFQES